MLLSILTTSIPHDANTFSACGEMMSGWQDSFLLKLVVHPVGDQSLISVINQSLISRRLVGEDFRAEVFMKVVSN